MANSSETKRNLASLYYNIKKRPITKRQFLLDTIPYLKQLAITERKKTKRRRRKDATLIKIPDWKYHRKILLSMRKPFAVEVM